MPQFFFHTIKDERCDDQVGVELPDMEAARIEAVRFLGEEMKDHPQELWSDGDWHVEVTDERGLVLLTVYGAAFRSAATGKDS